MPSEHKMRLSRRYDPHRTGKYGDKGQRELTSEASLRAVTLHINDRYLPLTDIATVSRENAEPPSRFTGQRQTRHRAGYLDGADR